MDAPPPPLLRRLAPLAVIVAGFALGLVIGPRAPEKPAFAPGLEASANLTTPAPATPEDHLGPVQKIAALAKKRDPLERDAAFYRAIQQMNARDFEALFADLHGLQEVIGYTDDPAGPFLHAALERWISLDEKSARRAGAVFLLEVRGNSSLRDTLVAVFAHHDPEWTLEQLSRPEARRGLVYSVTEAMRQIARDDPKRGKELLAKLHTHATGASERVAKESAFEIESEATEGWASGLAERDPLALLDYLKEPNCPTPGWKQVLEGSRAAARIGGGSAREYLQKLRGAATWRTATWLAAQTLASETKSDPLALLSEQAAIDPGSLASRVDEEYPAFHDILRSQKPERFLEWALDYPEPANREVLGNVLDAWGPEGLSDAAACLERIGKRHARPIDPTAAAQCRLRQACAAAEAGDVQGALRICSPADASSSAECMERLVPTLNEQNPHAARDWVQKLPPSEAKDRGAGWLASQRTDTPAESAFWVEQISRSGLREGRARQTFDAWNALDPEAAHTWIKSLSGVDERWRATLLRTNP